MKDDLSILIDLQKRDNAIGDLADQAASFDAQIKAQNSKLADLKNKTKSAKDKLTAVQMKKKNLENDATAKEGLIKKHQGELNNLKSNDAYKAMLGEIETAKNDLSSLEDQILETMEETDRAQADVKKMETEIKTEEAAIQSDIARLNEQKKAILADADQKKKDRDSFAASAPAPLTAQYDAIRKKSDGLAIVPLDGNACGGCRMTLPPNKVNAVKAAKQMVLCDNCSRILFTPQEAAKENQPT